MKSLGVIIVIGALALMATTFFPVSFYLKSRTERLEQLWSQDIRQVQTKKKMKQLFSNIRDYELSFSDPQVSDELDSLKIPFKINPDGALVLSIEVIRWIDKNRYGYILQHDIFDTSEDEPQKIYEFSRNYQIGIYW